MRKESLDFLKTLVTTPTPSGCEAAGQRIWCDYVRKFADEVRTDSYGNAVAVLNADGDPKIMLDGHVDEIGMMVKHIDDNGFVFFQRIGGVDPALVQAKRVNIHTQKGIVRGAVGATAIHLKERNKDPKVPKMHEVFIDIGAKDRKDAEKRISIGDPITFVDDFDQVHGDIAIARGFDNRAGVWAVAEALRLASRRKLNCAVYACSSVQEEVGLAGAKMTVDNVHPDAAIAVDVTHATDTPGINLKEHGEVKLGEGPTVSIGRENHPAMVDRLRKVAKAKKIAIQIETFSLTGGTDALAIYTKLGGVPAGLVSIPTRYMHSTVEMLKLGDLQHVAELLAAFVTDLKPGERFRVKV